MGLEGAKGEEGMKVKKGRQQAKSAPMSRAACRFMWCCGYHYTSSGGDGETRAMGRLWGSVCVYLCMYCTTLLFPILTQLMSPPKQTDF